MLDEGIGFVCTCTKLGGECERRTNRPALLSRAPTRYSIRDGRRPFREPRAEVLEFQAAPSGDAAARLAGHQPEEGGIIERGMTLEPVFQGRPVHFGADP